MRKLVLGLIAIGIIAGTIFAGDVYIKDLNIEPESSVVAESGNVDVQVFTVNGDTDEEKLLPGSKSKKLRKFIRAIFRA